MDSLTTTALIIAAITAATTWLGLRQPRILAHFGLSTASPSWLTSFTSALFHTSFKHYCTNMIALVCITHHLQGVLSVAQFVGIYCTGIIGGSMMFMQYGAAANKKAVGASAAVLGIIACAFCAHPSFIFFGMQVPGLLFVTLLLIVLYYDLESTTHGGWAHLGGVYYGTAAFLAINNGYDKNVLIILCFCIICIVIKMYKKYDY
jgi:membrane associated rhomboid family serine protease